MAHLLHINGDKATRVEDTTMLEEGLEETKHLEQWVVQHPDVIDDGLKIIATQYNRWASPEGGSAREALDVLALASSGQTVVMELKRGSDRKVHLQAITYGALVAGFDRQMLAEAHAQWQNRRGTDMTAEQALEALTEHLESDWDDEILKLPRLVLIAEQFPDQVLTTVQWLTSTAAAGLEIECHEYSLFKGDNGTYVSFQKRFPVEDLERRTLRPISGVDTEEVRDRIATRERRAKSVKVIADSNGIPEGARIHLDLNSMVKPSVVEDVNRWLDGDAIRRDVSRVNDPSKPLVWAAADDPTRRWSPTALRNEIFSRAGLDQPGFSAADAWSYDGHVPYEIAEEILAAQAENESVD